MTRIANNIKIEELFTHGRRQEKEYFDYLEDKKVIIVGPSSYLMGQQLGEFIDSYDVIVRLNLACPVPKALKKDIGSRTDILYHITLRDTHTKHRPDLFPPHTKSQIRGWKRDGVQWVVVKLTIGDPKLDKFASVINTIIPWMTLPVKTDKAMRKVVQGAPNIGTIAMCHLLQAPIKELYVTGCDFHQKGYYAGYGGFTDQQAKLGAGGGSKWGQPATNRVERISNRRVHKLAGQLFLLKTMLKQDSRFKPDEVLHQILEDHK